MIAAEIWLSAARAHLARGIDELLVVKALAVLPVGILMVLLVWFRKAHDRASVRTLREAWMSLSWKSSTRIFSLRSAVSSSVRGAGSAFIPSFTLVAYSLKRRSRSEVAFVDCAAFAGAAMAPSWPAAPGAMPCQQALSARIICEHYSCTHSMSGNCRSGLHVLPAHSRDPAMHAPQHGRPAVPRQ